jgi:hypothetical protein
MRDLHVSDGLISAIGEKGFRSLAVVFGREQQQIMELR